jgi:hypothetical protein
MPVCMKLGSSSHIEALVSMIELRNQIYTGGPRRLSNCIYATYECICVKYSAKSYVVSTLVCVGFVELFGVRFFTKQSSQRAYFYFHSPLYTRVWFCCAWCNSMAAFGYIWVLFVAPWCLCYRTSKSRLSDHAIKRDQFYDFGCYINVRLDAQKFVYILKVKQGIVRHDIWP